MLVNVSTIHALAFCMLFLCFGTTRCLKSLQIHVPQAVLAGETVQLSCSYDLEGAQLYSIRWYRNTIEFYRYVPKEAPATRVFDVNNIRIDNALIERYPYHHLGTGTAMQKKWRKNSIVNHFLLDVVKVYNIFSYNLVSLSDDHTVYMTDVTANLTGEYQCEVSADAPYFHTGIKSAVMFVVEPPLTSPNVKTDKTSYFGGDKIVLNCTAPPSFPPANLTWNINGENVPGYTSSNLLNTSMTPIAAMATLELSTQVPPVPSMVIRCKAELFDIWSSMSEPVHLKEKKANPASALERNSSVSLRRSWKQFVTTLVLLHMYFISFYNSNVFR